MIHVPRTVPAPADLLAKGRREVEAAKAHFAAPEKPFSGFKAYRLPSVKAALIQLFNGKCAYCEIDYGGAPLDVEHFRPKSAVVELNPQTFTATKKAPLHKPGYFCLAAEWENLLPSCIHCNRPETHVFPGHRDRVSGKSNYFPVDGPRCLDPNKDPEQVEARLLLDPCRDRPEEHLEFGPKGIIKPKDTAVGPDRKGLASIQVYGLQREPLVRRREERQIMLRKYLVDVARAAEVLRTDPNDQVARQQFLTAKQEIQDLFLDNKRAFLGMSRQIVAETLAPQ